MKILIHTGTAFLTLFLLAACGSAKSAAAAKAPGGGRSGHSRAIIVQVETSRSGDLEVDNTSAGTIVAATQSSVAAGAAGTVKTLLRKAGDWVKEGQPIIQLDTSQLQLALKIAKANLVNARINAGVDEHGNQTADSKVLLQLQSAQKSYNSAQALSKIGGIAASDLDTAQANLESAKMAVTQGGLAVDTAELQLQQAQLNMKQATIVAPYDGQVSVITVNPGEYVSVSTPVFGLVSHQQEISFSVSPADAVGLSIGQKVTFQYNGKTYPTRVTQSPSAPVNGLVTLTAALPADFQGTLGTVGTVAYSVTLASGTIVSLPTLQSAENKTFVFQIGPQNKVEQVFVTILSESGVDAVVTGLPGGVVIVDNPPPGLLPGAVVKALDANGKAVGEPGEAGQTHPEANGSANEGKPSGSRGRAARSGGH